MQNGNQLEKHHSHQATLMTDAATSQEHLDAWCQANGLDALLVTAQDAFLSEYTPLSSNQRFLLSGFTGSTGDGLFLTRALADRINTSTKFHLFVDGRYHLQADQETRRELVSVHKLTLASSLDEAIFSWIKEKFPAGVCLGTDTQRVGWSRWEALQNLSKNGKFQLKGYGGGEISTALMSAGWKVNRKIESLTQEYTGRNVQSNLQELRHLMNRQMHEKKWLFVTCMSDDAAWLLNARAYHLPQLSSCLAYTFISSTTCVVHLPEESSDCEIDLKSHENIIVTRGHLQNALIALQKADSQGQPFTEICFSERAMNAALPTELAKVFPQTQFHSDKHCIEELRVRKTEEELNSIRRSFLRSSRAIARTLRWAKDCSKNDLALSETDLAARIKTEYAAEGALELSFKTISGFGAHGAIIHYSTPSATTQAQQGELLLLDSGAYYAEGFATDCTRVVIFAKQISEVQPWQKEIYTLTLKSCLAGLRATFNLQTPCKDIDTLTRTPLKEKGYDYAHGTGHGIGIHVHENGIRLSPASQYTFTENAVVSVEPGIYLEGRGGVRIENVAIVVPREQTPTDSHTHTFENVVFVGYDWDLIDVQLLSEADKTDLIAYEKKCQSLGTAVTDCPLG